MQFGKKHTQTEPNRPGKYRKILSKNRSIDIHVMFIETILATPCSISRAVSNQFGGSSSTVNEISVTPSPSITYPSNTLTQRREFGSETDVRSTKQISTPASMSTSVHSHLPQSNSSLNTRGTDSPYAAIPAVSNTTANGSSSRSHSVHPYPSYSNDPHSLANLPNRQPVNNHYTSTTSLNSTASGGTTTTTATTYTAANEMIHSTSSRSIPLTRKTITEYPQGTYHVTFSDSSVMIIHADRTDGQTFIDSQGKRHLFDRRQLNQPEAIQERLTLMYQDEQELRNSSTA